MRLFLTLALLALASVAQGRPFRFVTWAPAGAPAGILAVHAKSSVGSTTDTTTYTSGTFTPSANQLLIAFFSSTRGSSTDPGAVTVSDSASLTWTLVSEFASVTTGTNRARVAVYATKAPSSPAAMTVTGTYGGTLTGCVMSIFEVVGADVSGTVSAAFVQAVTSTANSTGTSATITLSAAGNARNRAFMVAAHAANEDITPRASWTEITDGGIGTPSQSAELQWRSDAFETTASATWTTSAAYGAIALEIKSQ